MKLRNCFTFCISHLYSKWKLFFMSSIIIAISLIMVFQVMSVYLLCNYDIQQVHGFLKNNTKQLYKLESEFMTTDSAYYDRYNACVMELRERYEVVLYDNTNIYPHGLYNETFAEYLITHATDENILASGLPSVLRVDNGLLRLTDIKDSEGNLLVLGERDGKLEVAIGSFYEPIMPLGSVFSDRFTGQEYVVAYVLADNQRWMYGAIYNNGKLRDMGQWLVMPLDMENYMLGNAGVYANSVFLIADGEEMSVVEQEIQAVADKYDVVLKLEAFSEYERAYKDNNKDLYMFSLVLVIVLACAALLSVTVIALIAWLRDYHDIGVLRTNGFLETDIYKIVIMEELICLLFPVLAAYAFLLTDQTAGSFSMNYLQIRFFEVVLLFVQAIGIASGIICHEIKRQKPVVLIRGER